jgi:hypothetical protein
MVSRGIRSLPAISSGYRRIAINVARLPQLPVGTFHGTRTETSEEEEAGSDTWLTELLQRASREEDEDHQDFTPKRASNRNVYPG